MTATGFEHTRTFDLSGAVSGSDCVIATLPDWSGHVFFVTEQGLVGTVDPATGTVRTLQLDPGEQIVNSIAADETGAVYVVSTHRLLAVEAGPDGTPRIRWATAYDRGTRQKTGQLSQGSGTTPTLIGRDVVAITDNAEPRMHVQFYRRTGPRAGALICQAPVFAAGASATENTLAAGDGTSVIVENNYGYAGVQSTILGASTSPGVAKVVLHPDGTCSVAWTNPTVAPTSVPKVSWGNGLLYVYAKPASNLLDDSWYLTAIDVRTGRTVGASAPATGSSGTTTTPRSTSARTAPPTCPRSPGSSGSPTALERPG